MEERKHIFKVDNLKLLTVFINVFTSALNL